MKVITVANTKGGTGKSTISTNLAVMAAREGRAVLLIDADPQRSSSAWRALRKTDDIKAVSILSNTIHKDIAGFSQYDIVIVDSGGRDTKVLWSAIAAADLLLIPVLPSQYDVWAAADTIEILEQIRAIKPVPAFFVMNQVITGTRVSSEAETAIQEHSGKVDLFETELHARVAYKNIDGGHGVIEMHNAGLAAGEISMLWEEVKGRAAINTQVGEM